MSEAFLFRFGEYRTRVRFSDRGPEAELAAGDGLAVFDRNAHRHHGRAAGRAVVLPAGETAKAWRWAEKILASALEAGLGRDGRMVGIGGGVVCDLTAFAASLYMRGCALALAPTTLLGQKTTTTPTNGTRLKRGSIWTVTPECRSIFQSRYPTPPRNV